VVVLPEVEEVEVAALLEAEEAIASSHKVAFSYFFLLIYVIIH
jgi:hypothetical protein